MAAPDPSVLREVAAAQVRFEAAIAGLTDADGARPSALPGWTLGHLLTHMARNADSHLRRTLAAQDGQSVEQYPGGPAGRAAEIEAGAVRPMAEQLADLHDSAVALADAWVETSGAAWDVTSFDVGGRERATSSLPERRWQELEVHLLDLGLGHTEADWSDAFVAHFLPIVRSGLASRLPEGAAAPTDLDPRTELAWLYTRSSRPDLPALASWS